MKCLIKSRGRVSITKKRLKHEISSPVDLFYNDKRCYKNQYPDKLLSENLNINKIKPKVAEINNLYQLKEYLKAVGMSLISDVALKFVITKQRKLLLGEFIKRSRNEYVTHPAIINSLGYNAAEEVLAAGRIVGFSDYSGNLQIFATNESGHFKPGNESIKHLDALIRRWGGYGAFDDDD
ncbi:MULTISPECIES: hypothetical protein [unclassified Pantoea]|uniref:hypothetical protein n=1 Tax=unclassified Pantoea TaxID=2630326 RepID=UPI0023DB2DDF|nr:MULTISPECIES: hypothetical protein [unclassified Pantoea]MDF2071295.1 hypothetical protein [Pantoea sp. Cr_R13]MDF2080421.1 hypothetical protein [Pantoea sp. Cr_R21]